MGIKLGEIAGAGSSFFKPEEWTGAVALLVEPTKLDYQVPSKFGPKDTMTAHFTSFASVEDIDTDGGNFVPSLSFQQIDLVKKVAHLVGSAAVVTVEKLPPSAKLPNGAWVWNQVDAEVRDKVAAYLERREAKAAEALAAMPSFA